LPFIGFARADARIPQCGTSGAILAWQHFSRDPQRRAAAKNLDAPLPCVLTTRTMEASMSSPEELTLVVGRWLRPVVFVLDVVRRFKPAPTSSREQVSTPSHH
jgi:hypothetical protein